MNAKNFKNLNERDFRLWSLFVLIVDKQSIFWKRSSQIFIILLFLLKFSQVFKIISCSFADLWFIIRFAFHDLTIIIQSQNILIYFIRTAIFRNIFYALTVTKIKLHIIENALQPLSILYSHLHQSKQNAFFFSKCERRLCNECCVQQDQQEHQNQLKQSISIMTSTSSWMFDDDESRSHSWLTVNISVFSILMNSWMFYHSLLRYIFLLI